MMNVAQLIEKLKHYPPTIEVFIQIDSYVSAIEDVELDVNGDVLITDILRSRRGGG